MLSLAAQGGFLRPSPTEQSRYGGKNFVLALANSPRNTVFLYLELEGFLTEHDASSIIDHVLLQPLLELLEVPRVQNLRHRIVIIGCETLEPERVGAISGMPGFAHPQTHLLHRGYKLAQDITKISLSLLGYWIVRQY